MRWITLLCALALCACSTTSGVVASGPDTYTVIMSGGTGFKSSGSLKIEAYQRASAFCAARNSRLTVVDENEQRAGPFGKYPEAQVHFRCERT